MCASFPFGFMGGMWDLTVLVPGYCLFCYSLSNVHFNQMVPFYYLSVSTPILNMYFCSTTHTNGKYGLIGFD